MKVLMFGWEFPPKILGGLAVASYGITKGLSLQGDVETTFCLPKPTGEEEKFLHILGMNQVPIVWRDVDYASPSVSGLMSDSKASLTVAPSGTFSQGI